MKADFSRYMTEYDSYSPPKSINGDITRFLDKMKKIYIIEHIDFEKTI